MTKAVIDPYAPELPTIPADLATPPPVGRTLSFHNGQGALEVCKKPEEQKASTTVSTAAMIEEVSSSALKKRIARLMTPKSDGSFKVPKELVEAWKTGDQERLTQEFVDAGYNKEPIP